MTEHQVVSREQWIEASRALLAEEKAWTRQRDRLSEKRRALPWVRIDKGYVFQGAGGPVTLADLYDGRLQSVEPGRAVERPGPAERQQSPPDLQRVPQRAVLVEQEDGLAHGVGARRGARGVELH